MENVTLSLFVLQTWFNNMGKTGEANIKPFDGEEYTCITFRPDLPKFKMTILDKDTVALMTRRAYDIAGATKGLRVYFNGKKLPVCYHIDCLRHHRTSLGADLVIKTKKKNVVF